MKISFSNRFSVGGVGASTAPTSNLQPPGERRSVNSLIWFNFSIRSHQNNFFWLYQALPGLTGRTQCINGHSLSAHVLGNWYAMMNSDTVRTDHDLSDQQPSYLLFLFHVELLS